MTQRSILPSNKPDDDLGKMSEWESELSPSELVEMAAEQFAYILWQQVLFMEKQKKKKAGAGQEEKRSASS